VEVEAKFGLVRKACVLVVQVELKIVGNSVEGSHQTLFVSFAIDRNEEGFLALVGSCSFKDLGVIEYAGPECWSSTLFMVLRHLFYLADLELTILIALAVVNVNEEVDSLVHEEEVPWRIDHHCRILCIDETYLFHSGAVYIELWINDNWVWLFYAYRFWFAFYENSRILGYKLSSKLVVCAHVTICLKLGPKG